MKRFIDKLQMALFSFLGAYVGIILQTYIINPTRNIAVISLLSIANMILLIIIFATWIEPKKDL